MRILNILLTLILFGSLTANAEQQYTFTKIASNQGVHYFAEYSLNNSGVVAYLDPVPTATIGVYTPVLKKWKNGTVTEVLTSTKALGSVRINDSEAIAFAEADLATLAVSIKIAQGGNITTVASAGPRFLGFRVPPLEFDNRGNVYFIGVTSFTTGCLCTAGASELTIARETDLQSLGSSIPRLAVSGNGSTAFIDAFGTNTNIVLFENGVKTVLPGTGVLNNYQNLDFNSGGDLVYSEFRLTTVESSIYLRSQGKVTTIASSQNPSNPGLVDRPKINDSGTVAYTRGEVAILTIDKGINSKVIAVNDPLFGSTLSHLFIQGDMSFNNNGQILFNYELNNGETGLALATPVTGSAPTPDLTAGSVANGASYVPEIVAGSWAQVKGTNLAPSTRIWTEADFNNGSNLPTSLDGVEVRVNNLPAAVYYISPTQVSFQVPSGVSGTVNVQVIRAGVPSATITANVVNSSPALFTYVLFGKVFPAAVFNNTTLVVGDPALAASAVRKAAPGDRIALYATGLEPSPAGVIPSLSVLSGVTATIGTTPATVEFAGLVTVGEYQINIIVPTLPAGEYPITIRYNGKNSQTGVVIPVQP